MFDILIKNGTVVDGTGAVPFKANVAVKDGKITMLMKCEEPEAKEVINAAGKYVCPGFIDSHSHGDLVLGRDYAHLCKTAQGITTEVTGQCGNSQFPSSADPDLYAQQVSNTLNLADLGRGVTSTFEAYRNYLESTPKTAHIRQFVGHNPLRSSVMGWANRAPTAAELENMKSLLRECMESGAIGLTTGLVYAPGCFADQKEVTELCKVVAEYNGVYATHMRNSGDRLAEAVTEALDTAREADCRLLISHHKSSRRPNWGRSPQILALTDAAFDAGQEVAFDVYPYTSSMTSLSSCLPHNEFSYSLEERLERLRNPNIRAELRRQIENKNAGPFDAQQYFSDILMVYCVKTPQYQGKTIAQAAAEENRDPFDVFFDILLEGKYVSSSAFHSMCEEDMSNFFTNHRAMMGTDGLVYSMTTQTHPRGFCSFPHAINYFVKEKKLLTLEETIRKMTSFPAQWLKLDNKGVLRDGFDADVVIFDLDTIKGGFTFGEPITTNPGIEQVLVDGVTVFKDGALTGATPGRVLLHNR